MAAKGDGKSEGPVARTAPWKDDDVWGITPLPVSEDDSHDLGRKRHQRVRWLEGLRGLLALEMLLYIFFRLLAPAIASDTDLDGTYPAAFLSKAPAWHNTLRKALSPLFWNPTLLSTFFLVLSGRVAALTFLERRSATTLAGAVFRRPVRLLLPILVGLAVTSIVSVAKGFGDAQRLSDLTSNSAARPPAIWTSFLEYLNSVFALYFNTNVSLTDRSITFLPPSGLAWVLPVVFQQTFTAYVFAALLPYVTLRAKLWGFAGFIVAAYWVGSWAWYTLTGLQLAEFSLVYLPLLKRRSLPVWLVPSAFLVLGVGLEYAWATHPQHRNVEYRFHTDKGSGQLNRYLNPYTTPYPRVDDYFVVLGALSLLELSPMAQRVMGNPVLRYLGRISLMLYLTAGTVCLALGSHLFVLLTETKGWSSPSSVLAALFFACVPLCIAVAEVAYWLAEWPGSWFSRWLFVYLRAE
ncbi:unnamed protein product [Parajaminaea phylloscopi]